MELKQTLLKLSIGIQLVAVVILVIMLGRKRYQIVGNTTDTVDVVMRESKGFKVVQDEMKVSTQTVTPPRINVSHGAQTNTGGESVYSERIKLANEMCRKYAGTSEWKSLNPTGVFYSYGGPNGIHYCIVPKVGCTFWKRIFRFLNKDYPQNANISRPSQIERDFVHYGGLKWTKVTSFKDRPSLQLFSGGSGFMFSRDPYTRLWSAYVDKFYLPDFWRSFASYAVKSVRPKTAKDQLGCPKNVTFPEFLQYIVNTRNALNEHWQPIYKICSPCHFGFDIIGKQESFSSDVKFILNRYRLDYLVEEEDPIARVDGEVSMLMKYNFGLENKINKGCFDKMEVAHRIWTAFQINGYIHNDTPFKKESLDLKQFESDPTAELLKLVRGTLTDQRNNNVSVKAQKRETMVQAYRSVPNELLNQIKTIYKYDFELFGYDIEPQDIYLR